MHHATPKTMHNTMLRRKTKNFIGPYGPTVINKYLDNGLTLVSYHSCNNAQYNVEKKLKNT